MATAKETSNAITFDVGGRIYKLSRSTLELHPTTMLARLADKIWEKENPTDAHFIDRNGDLFQYVLDYMRDGDVNLPMTVSKRGFWKEMDFYGFDNVKDSSVAAGTLAEAREIMAAVLGNETEDIEALRASIRDSKKSIEKCEHRIGAIKTAHTVFVRSNGQEWTDGRATVRFRERSEQMATGEALRVGGYFGDCLGKYGLALVSVDPPEESPYGSKYYADLAEYCDIVVERTKTSEN